MGKHGGKEDSEHSAKARVTCTTCNCCTAAYRLKDGSPLCYSCAWARGHKFRSFAAAARAGRSIARDAAEGRLLVSDMEALQLVARAISRGEQVDADVELLDQQPAYTFKNHYLRAAGFLFVIARDFLRGKTSEPDPNAFEFDVFLEKGLDDLQLNSCLLAQELKIAIVKEREGLPIQFLCPQSFPKNSPETSS